jgi:hypothetical protein
LENLKIPKTTEIPKNSWNICETPKNSWYFENSNKFWNFENIPTTPKNF